MAELSIGIKIAGKNGASLVLKENTKEEIVARLRAIILNTTGIEFELTHKNDVISLMPDPVATWALVWDINRKNRPYVGFTRKTETWKYPIIAINEFCRLAYDA